MVLLLLLCALIFAEWTIQTIWFNASCKPDDADCIEYTSKWTGRRLVLAVVSFSGFLLALYFALRKRKTKQ